MEASDHITKVRDFALDRIKQPEVFVRLSKLASEMFDCPTACISVLDEHHQWFLGRQGLSCETLAREPTNCTLCIDSETPLLVADFRQDLRFRDRTNVWQPDAPRSYLAMPLFAQEAIQIGTMCCASPRPRAFEVADLVRIQSLAKVAEQAIDAHVQTRTLARENSSLSKLNRLFQQAQTAAEIGSWRVDLKTDELHWSDQVFAIHGIPVGTPLKIAEAIEFYEPEDRPLVERTLERVIEKGEPFSFEATIRRKDGHRRRIRAMGERIDIDGEAESIAGVFLDCTEEHLQTIALQRAATRDPLTNLYNRGEFDRRLVEALSERRSRGPDCPITVMLLDLDGFKDVNDRLGHLVGDRLLVQIAQALDRRADGSLFLARWGGDEFAILFPTGQALDEALALAKRLATEIAEQVRVGDRYIQVSATCGLAVMKDDAAAEELMRRADLALYHGKANGKGSVHCWSHNIEKVQVARQAAIAQLSEALNTGRAFAAYQPIVKLDTHEVVGVEALLRLRDHSERVISAGKFVPALLDPVLARRVSHFMRAQILTEAPGLLAIYGPHLRIGLNVSEADLSRGDFYEFMNALIANSPLEPNNIVLEVTETMLLLDEAGDIRELLNRLDQRGFTVALDDFGTGFSSLTHLRDFPIRKVKIDKDFIASISHDHQSRLIVQAMVQMGQSLDIRMVAEGVETEEQMVFLRAIGCSHAQGFKFARPASIEELQAAHKTPARPASTSQNAA